MDLSGIPQVYTVLGSVAWDRIIIGLCHHGFTVNPLSSLANFLSSSIEADVILHFTSLDFKGVPVLQPIIRDFNLVAVHYFLLKYAVVVSDTIAPSRVL